LRLLAFVLSICSALYLVGCGPGGNEGAGDQPSPQADAAAIREFDFSAAPATQTLLRQLGSGTVDSRGVIFADFTGDQREEAVVPVTSQGTLGNIAFLVFRLESGRLEPILTRTLDRSARNGLMMSVENAILVESAGVYGNEDPLCCPTLLRVTRFRWDGALLQVDREERVPQPSAKQ
jgi:hypothetical protein